MRRKSVSQILAIGFTSAILLFACAGSTITYERGDRPPSAFRDTVSLEVEGEGPDSCRQVMKEELARFGIAVAPENLHLLQVRIEAYEPGDISSVKIKAAFLNKSSGEVYWRADYRKTSRGKIEAKTRGIFADIARHVRALAHRGEVQPPTKPEPIEQVGPI